LRARGPEQVLTYFSRYARKVAISNSRVRSYDGETVEFHWRDRADGNRRKLRRLGGATFTRLFLQHVLPRRFVRIRHYGLLANRSAQSFARSRDLLARNETAPPAPQLPPAGETRAEATLRLFGKNPLLCPACRRGRLVALAVASACGKVRWLGTPFPTPKPTAVVSAPARAPT